MLLAYNPNVSKVELFATLKGIAHEENLMDITQVVQVSARVGWIIEISQQDDGYRYWLVNRELDVLSDGQVYATSSAALAAGRLVVERN